jgi:tRNA A-37 threonylcarbamoyl transferase component Bud32
VNSPESRSGSEFPTGLRKWVEVSLERNENILATSNQGTVLRFQGDGLDWVIKAAMGGAAMHKLRQNTLNREFRAYERLVGVKSIPACHGMLADRYLVLNFVRGVPFRDAAWSDREAWFSKLLRVIENIHSHGVCHGDLKTKGNLMVTDDEQPCIIDFGTSFVHRDGFHPVANFLYNHFRQMDLNAWVKHKYHGQYSNVSEEDAHVLHYSRIERFWRKYVHRLPLR